MYNTKKLFIIIFVIFSILSALFYCSAISKISEGNYYYEEITLEGNFSKNISSLSHANNKIDADFVGFGQNASNYIIAINASLVGEIHDIKKIEVGYYTSQVNFSGYINGKIWIINLMPTKIVFGIMGLTLFILFVWLPRKEGKATYRLFCLATYSIFISMAGEFVFYRLIYFVNFPYKIFYPEMHTLNANTLLIEGIGSFILIALPTSIYLFLLNKYSRVHRTDFSDRLYKIAIIAFYYLIVAGLSIILLLRFYITGYIMGDIDHFLEINFIFPYLRGFILIIFGIVCSFSLISIIFRNIIKRVNNKFSEKHPLFKDYERKIEINLSPKFLITAGIIILVGIMFILNILSSSGSISSKFSTITLFTIILVSLTSIYLSYKELKFRTEMGIYEPKKILYFQKISLYNVVLKLLMYVCFSLLFYFFLYMSRYLATNAYIYFNVAVISGEIKNYILFTFIWAMIFTSIAYLLIPKIYFFGKSKVSSLTLSFLLYFIIFIVFHYATKFLPEFMNIEQFGYEIFGVPLGVVILPTIISIGEYFARKPIDKLLYKRCPHCGYLIKHPNPLVCPNCGEQLY